MRRTSQSYFLRVIFHSFKSTVFDMVGFEWFTPTSIDIISTDHKEWTMQGFPKKSKQIKTIKYFIELYNSLLCVLLP
jgi:hypothetical protein